MLLILKEWSRLESDQRCSSSLQRVLPCYHPELALCNVIFDSIDDTKIAGLIYWGGAQSVLLILTAKFPSDLISMGDDPRERDPLVRCFI